MGRQAEFEELARPHLDALYRTALRLAGQEATAQDLVQETLLRAWRSFERFEPGTSFRSWLFRILTNAFFNEYERRSRGPIPTDFGEVEPAGAEEEVPYLTVRDVERMGERLGDQARRALARLPAEFRVVFHLATFEGFHYREIADATGLPLGTVMSRLFRARRFLRRELAATAREAAQRQERSER